MHTCSAIESVVSAGDGLVDAASAANSGDSATAIREAGQAVAGLAAALSSSGVLKGASVAASAEAFRSAAGDLYNSTNALEALQHFADALSAVGSIMAAIPTPQTRAIGTAISIGMTAVKRSIEIYRESNDPSDLSSPSSAIPTIIPGITDMDWSCVPGLPSVIDPACNTNYRNGLAPPRPRDPLAIDLDSDGIETVGVGASPILFDHNADGIRTGTGWVRPDDAWLVLDRDGNGLIDTGRELFGVDTLLSGTPGVDAVYASTGFQALGSLNSNGDGVFNASDAAFGAVRLWQDLNQDGVSQAAELSTLAQKNITSIGLVASASTVNLGNGNTLTGTAVVTRTTGASTQVGSVAVGADSTAGNLNLANNPFYREFTDSIAFTAAAVALPEMRGSGAVRDLREADFGLAPFFWSITSEQVIDQKKNQRCSRVLHPISRSDVRVVRLYLGDTLPGVRCRTSKLSLPVHSFQMRRSEILRKRGLTYFHRWGLLNEKPE